jgi:sulfite exporter TauE/SafE
MMNTGYFLAFTTGLIGGFGHCIGMCGPLVASSALHSAVSGRASFGDRFVPQALYNIGRITTYGAVGAVMGIAGSFVNVATRLAGIQNGVMIAAGLIMAVMGLSLLGIMGGTGWLEQHNTLVLALTKKIFTSRSGWKYMPLGLVMGLLPCGLSYTVFIAAAGTGAPLAGTFTMLAFGAGTVPALAIFGIVVSYFGSRLRARMQKAGGAVVVAMGLYYIVKGIELYAYL